MGRVILHNITSFSFNLLTNVAIRRTPPHRCPHGFRYLRDNELNLATKVTESTDALATVRAASVSYTHLTLPTKA